VVRLKHGGVGTRRPYHCVLEAFGDSNGGVGHAGPTSA
jgi:hypothetical protein